MSTNKKDPNGTTANATDNQPEESGATPEPDMVACSPAFYIDRISADGNSREPEEVVFLYDKYNQPIHIGDGSFGVVFKGRGRDEEKCAIKLLYDNASINSRPLDGLQPEDIDKACALIAQKVVETEKGSGQGGDAKELEKSLTDDLKTAVKGNMSSPDSLAIEVAKVLSKTDYASLNPDAKATMAYLRSLTSSDAADRFRRERDVTVALRNAYGSNPEGTVDVWGGTENFLGYVKSGVDTKRNSIMSNPEESKQWQFLNDYFDNNLKIKVSDFALVMGLYSFSLKDLLEKSPDALNKNLDKVYKLEGPKGAQRGYDLLQSLTFKKRMREALLLLQEVVEGLDQLHNTFVAAGEDKKEPFLHLDIKSGNIYIRRRGSDRIKTVLGDLGNLPPKPDNSTGIALSGLPASTLLQAPGTPNFRSPEQKYHLEVAYAKVTLNDHTVTLEVRDPKFVDSLLVKRDFVVFSKDKNRTKRYIESIKTQSDASDSSGNPDTWTYTLTPTGDEQHTIANAESIQVEFHKQQRHRTDLFGIGAVVYDIITCGQSPERFYESIRKFEGEPIPDIIRRYTNLKIGVAEQDNPDLLAIFKPFRRLDGSEYADNEVVEFILKCMLYKSPGTFFSDRHFYTPDGMSTPDAPSLAQNGKFEGDNDDPEIDACNAVKLMRRAFNTLHGIYTDASQQPALIFGAREDQNVKPAWGFVHEVNLLQRFDLPVVRVQPPFVAGMQNTTDPRLREMSRLVMGAFDFFLLSLHVLSYIGPNPEKENKRTFLHQMQPESIFTREGNNVILESDAQAYSTANDYLTDMRNSGLARLVRQASNAFVPAALAGMRREVQLMPIPGDQNVTTHYQIQTKDASSFNVMVQDGDYLVSKRDLWQVRAAMQGQWRLEPKVVVDSVNDRYGLGNNPTTIFSHLDPYRYYLDMLAIYLQNLVFAHSDLTTATRDRINLAGMLQVLSVPKPFSLVFAEDMFPSKTKLHTIYTKYTYLMLKLRLHDAQNSFYAMAPDDLDEDITQLPDDVTKREKSQRESLKQVIRFAKDQYVSVRAYVGLEPMTSESARPSITELKKEKLNQELETLMGSKDHRFDIERTVKESKMIWVGAPTSSHPDNESKEPSGDSTPDDNEK